MNSTLLCVRRCLDHFDHISVLCDLRESNGTKSPDMGKINVNKSVERELVCQVSNKMVELWIFL